MAERPKLLSELGKARLNRASGMGLNGLAASTIGFVMLGCIAVGYFAGSWLDRKLGTTWAMPAGAFLGMAAGFVEMFRTLKQIGERTKWPGAKSEPASGSASGPDSKGATEVGAPARTDDDATDLPVKQRLFNVPPPPLPEFESRAHKTDGPTTAEVAASLNEGLDELSPDRSTERDLRNDND